MSTLTCPRCGAQKVVKNGRIHNGKQNHKCRACGRQFVEDPQQKRIDPHTKALIDKLLLEKLPLAGIARVCNVSESWLQEYVNLDLAPFAFTVRARSARTVNADFGGAKRRRNQLVENAARSELTTNMQRCNGERLVKKKAT
jgi:DNA-directed RNA polymerase subunit RPC12/RpoP